MVMIFFTDAHRETSSALAIYVWGRDASFREMRSHGLKAKVGHRPKQLQT